MIDQSISRLVFGLFMATSLASASAQAADAGVHGDRIVFGQPAALEGPAAALGIGMRHGLLAAFGEANATGGVHGRSLELISADDGYEPEKSVIAMRKLIEQDKVFAIVGPVGTPTTSATVPIAEETGVPFIGPFTGAGFLRDPKLRMVVNVRASYNQETEAWVERLTTDLKIRKIAILYQDDSFGQAGLSGVRAAMERRGLSLVAEGNYPRNTMAVKTALLTIRKAEPEAVVMVGAYAPCAEFIKLARSLKMNPVFVNISFVGSNALAATLGAAGAGVIVSQVVPLPEDTSIPVVGRYQKALAQAVPDAKPGFGSLEGYLVGRLVVEALGRIDGEPTRTKLLEAITGSGPYDLGGVSLSYGPGDNQGSDRVFFTVIQSDGAFRAIETLSRGN